MYDFNTHQRMLLHLSRFSNLDVSMDYGAPTEITQDGAAAALGITRSHACTTLLRMEKAREVLVGLSRVSGSNCKVKKKIYVLSEHGKEVLKRTLDELEASGVPRSELELSSPVNRMSSDMMREMAPEDRAAIGMLCVLRRNRMRQELDLKCGYGMPFDGKGNLSIRADARERFLSTATEKELKSWNSAAADQYQGTPEDLPERLHHLIRARRLREALKLARENRFPIADSMDAGVLDSMRELCESTGDRDASLTATLLALRLGDTATAEAVMAFAGDGDEAKAMRAEVLLAEGRTEEALETALDCYSSDGFTSLALGKCMNAAGRPEEALVYLRMSRRRMMESGCLFRLDEVMEQEAAADRAIGRDERAAALERAAESVRRNGPDRRRGRARTVQRTVLPLRMSRSEMYSSLMSLMSHLSMASLSKPNPHARTGVFTPSGSRTSGLNMPAPPSSIHLPLKKTSSSRDGSVYGKYAGRMRILSNPILA